MSRTFLFQAIAKFLAGVLLVFLLLFLPAGTLAYEGGWILMGCLFLPMLGAGVVMMLKNPALLRRRLEGKETESRQKTVVKLSGLMFLSGFVAAGLSFRFQVLMLPRAAGIAGGVILILSYLLYGEVLRENAYLSRTIKVEEGQQLIDTGLYGIVRHPMYAATVALFCSMPLALGSGIACVIFLAYPILIVLRIRNEEEVLLRELPGYAGYKKRVKYRLIPFIW